MPARRRQKVLLTRNTDFQTKTLPKERLRIAASIDEEPAAKSTLVYIQQAIMKHWIKVKNRRHPAMDRMMEAMQEWT
jgi:hypothetical protein